MFVVKPRPCKIFGRTGAPPVFKLSTTMEGCLVVHFDWLNVQKAGTRTAGSNCDNLVMKKGKQV